MRLFTRPYSLLFPLLPALVKSQSQNLTYIQELVSALQSTGLDGLANAVTTVNGSGPGQALFAQISSGNNYTFFAPTNDAIQSVPSQISGNATLLAEYLSYHFVSGNFLNASWTNTSSGGAGGGTSSSTFSTSSATPSSSSSFLSSSSEFTSASGSGSSTSFVTVTATPSTVVRNIFRHRKSPSIQSNESSPQPYAGIWPNVTIGRTLLNAPEFVTLPGSQNQVLAWTRSWENGNVTILNQIQNVTVVDSTLWRNLFINRIDGYLSPPDSLSTALTAVGATNTEDLLSLIPVSSANGTNVTALDYLAAAPGITVLIPNNAAFTSDVNQTLEGLMNNQSAVVDLLQNHYVNGSSLYSSVLVDGSNATSAAGETLQFSRNDTGLFVSGPNGTSAQVVRPDVLLKNGVGHVINAVLIDTDSDPSAASQAYSSATASAASATTTETGPIGVIGGPTSVVSATTTTFSSFSSSSSGFSSSSALSSSSSALSSSSSALSSLSSALSSSTQSSTSPSTSLSTSTTPGGGTVTVTASVLAKSNVYNGATGIISTLGVVGSTIISIAAGAFLLI